MITRDDVAKHAGVSSATVSRVINNSDKVSDELKQRVMKSIIALDYKPNYAAKSLRTQKTYVIGYIVPDITNSYYTQIYKGISSVLSKHNYRCYIIEKRMMKEPFDWHEFDAIIISGYIDNELLKNINIPIIYSSHQKISYDKAFRVGHDMSTVSRSVYEYLYKIGHRNIGLLINDNPYNDRYGAYKDFLKEHQLPFNEEYVIKFTQKSYYYDLGYDSMMRLLNKKLPVTAVVSQNDLIAIGAMAAAHKLGYKIPEDIGFIGYNDTLEARYCYPPLTTVKFYKEKQGEKMAELLINYFQGNQVCNYEFKAEMIFRDSI